MNPVCIGIDVGAARKGYHAVALLGSTIVAKLPSPDARVIARWCVAQRAAVVAVDAPCRWRRSGAPARAAERELARNRISCFSTPTEADAHGHPFYTWMFAGQELYAALASHFPLFVGDGQRKGVSFETFPQAIACALAGEPVSAKTKFASRTQLLLRAGVDVSELEHIDEVDATLCALAAKDFAENNFKAYGDRSDGFIVVPAGPSPPLNGTAAERRVGVRAQKLRQSRKRSVA